MTSTLKDIIRRVVGEEVATDPRTTYFGVIGMGLSAYDAHARRHAMLRVMRETGCSPAQLALAWGCDRSIPMTYARQAAPRSLDYDERTKARLLWLHGPKRASIIFADRDPATEADIAAWRRLGTPHCRPPESV